MLGRRGSCRAGAAAVEEAGTGTERAWEGTSGGARGRGAVRGAIKMGQLCEGDTANW